MRRAGLASACIALCALAVTAARAQDCAAEAERAERAAGLPRGLLEAIGLAESGRPDPRTGQLAPWPWTVNNSGIGHVFATRAAAVAYVIDQQGRGARALDVGCFQVDLLYHPAAFATVDEAFDPGANARYAAGFLARLRARVGNWPEAVGLYHSATPWRGEAYRATVLARWSGGSSPASAAADGRVLRIRVRVEVPTGTGVQVSLLASRVGRLPRVVTPSWAGR
jgi:soluble lytic murein transglycosylase-like protein